MSGRRGSKARRGLKALSTNRTTVEGIDAYAPWMGAPMKVPTDLLRWISLFAFASVTGCISPMTGGDTDSGSSGTSTTSTPTTTTAGQSTAGTSSSGGSSASRGSSEATTAGGLPPGSGCCDPHAGPGCDEAAVQECVCEESAPCCGFDWSQECVDLAQGSCAATCEPDGTTTGDTAGPTSDDTGQTEGDSSSSSGFGPGGSSGGFELGPCCEAIGAGAGCLHQPTQECVCAVNSSCCEDGWTAECAALAESDCNACTSGDCCAPQNAAGCNDETVEACVCNLDDFCCNQTFDEICADLAASDCNACQDER